jgi:hypothetical protein
MTPEPGTEPREMRNPFRSEADAFRLLMIIGAGALAVILAAVAIGPGVGAVLAAVLLSAGIWSVFQWLREGIAPDHRPEDAPEQDDDVSS